MRKATYTDKPTSENPLPKTYLVAGLKHDVRNLDSIAPLFKPDDSKCGVYRLRFDDGDAYVGQSVTVVSRYVDHFKRWGRKIQSFEFFPAEKGLLDELERELITVTEQDSSVKNVLLTRRPRGDQPYEFEVEEGVSVSLPWERKERITINEGIEKSHLERWLELNASEYFAEIADVVAWFISETIPDPLRTAGRLWTLTCLPSTGRQKGFRRLVALSCGNIETLVITEEIQDDELGADVRINTTPVRESEKLQDPDGKWYLENLDAYNIAETTSWFFRIQNFRAVIEGELEFPYLQQLTEGAYELNVQNMRHGGTMYTRFHNAPFARDMLAQAAFRSAEKQFSR